MIPKVAECDDYKVSDANIIIIAHGSVAEASKHAIDLLRLSGKKVGLVRPITLRPLDCKKIQRIAGGAKKVFIIESAFEQLARLVLYKIPEIAAKTVKIFKPAEGFTPEEIESIISEKNYGKN